MRIAFLLPLTIALPAVATAKPSPCPHPKASVTPAEGSTPKARKLTELPPATTYMAVLRTVRGCPAPLTMSEYRAAKPR